MRNARDDFWSLWQQHSDFLFRQSLRLMKGNRSDAEDACGEAMVRACNAFSRQAPQLVNERAWLLRVLHNICVDTHRMRRRYESAPLSLEEEACGELLAPGVSPEAAFLRQEGKGHLRRHILALPPNLREASDLRFLQDMSYEDIATHLGLTNCNVRKRIQLSSRILRSTLGTVRPDSWRAGNGRPSRTERWDWDKRR